MLAAALEAEGRSASAKGGAKESQQGSTLERRPLLSPQPLEPASGDPGVMGCVLVISLPEVVLHGSQIGALVGEIIAAGMPQHVRPDAARLLAPVTSPSHLIGS